LLRPPETPLDKAIALIKANKHAAAVPILEGIARSQPDDEEVFPWLAQCYLRTDRIAEGRTALDTALKLKLPCPITVPVILAYADYYEGKDDFSEAEKLFQSASGACPEKDMLTGKAHMYMRWSDSNNDDGETELALNHLKMAYELLPDGDQDKNTLPHKISEYYRQLAAVAETEEKNDSKAIDLLETSLKTADEPATRMALGGIYSRTNQSEKAIENFRAVCLGDANNLEARHHLIDLYSAANNMEGAQQALLELTEKEKSVENFEALANLSLKLSNYACAVRALEDAIVLRPKDLPLLDKLHGTLITWSGVLVKQGKLDECGSVKGHADRVAELIKEIQKADEKLNQAKEKDLLGAPGSPPVQLVASRIWLAKGSFTPEGEIRLKNISGQPVSNLALTIVFYDNTAKRKNGSVTVSAASESHPMQPDTIQSVYFSCPNIVKSDHHLAVIIVWQGRLLKELPVVKER
jgi:tetratricopeptide (TPR) repeat protein